MISACLALLAPTTYLITGGTVYDGLSAPRLADLRIRGSQIVQIGLLAPNPGETIIRAAGLVVAPGFIDAHSHADSRLADDPSAESQIRQGITTAVVGQDGGGSTPILQLFNRIQKLRPTLNFAAFAGHGAIRRKVLKDDFMRTVNAMELSTMAGLLDEDLAAGALGLSSGLEYDPGYYSSYDELLFLCRRVEKANGMYISHVRDEGNGAFKSFQELVNLGRQAKIPAQISHLKLATASVWHRAKDVIAMVDKARKSGIDITADLYPYLYWQSTITVLTLEKDYEDRSVWERALRDVGGAGNVLLSSYSPKPEWVGKTIAQIATMTGKDEISIIQEIIRETSPPNKGTESIVCTAMNEEDLIEFMKCPWVMFCSDGTIGGSHPRGAGAFPRILGEYVRKRKVISLQSAITKMTSLPAKRISLDRRGTLKPGNYADIVVFDPKQIADRATPKNPRTFSIGVRHVFINGRPVLLDGKMTDNRPGVMLRRQANGRVTSDAPKGFAIGR